MFGYIWPNSIKCKGESSKGKGNAIVHKKQQSDDDNSRNHNDRDFKVLDDYNTDIFPGLSSNMSAHCFPGLVPIKKRRSTKSPKDSNRQSMGGITINENVSSSKLQLGGKKDQNPLNHDKKKLRLTGDNSNNNLAGDDKYHDYYPTIPVFNNFPMAEYSKLVSNSTRDPVESPVIYAPPLAEKDKVDKGHFDGQDADDDWENMDEYYDEDDDWETMDEYYDDGGNIKENPKDE